jgi:hypothetical protein
LSTSSNKQVLDQIPDEKTKEKHGIPLLNRKERMVGYIIKPSNHCRFGFAPSKSHSSSQVNF